jgi:transcriptional regulator with XRE-family HTH domain
MQKIQIEVTKLYKILSDRSMTQKDLHKLIGESNNGKSISMYILNEIVNGKRKNYNINTAILISNALNLPIDDIVD